MSVTSASTVSSVSAGGYVSSPPGADTVAQKATVGVATSSQAPSAERITQAVGQVNDAFTNMGQNLSASIVKDRVSGITVVQVTEKSTNQVVTQFPSKAIVALAEALTQSHDVKGKMLHVAG